MEAPAPLATDFAHLIASTGKEEKFAHLSYEDIFVHILPAHVADKRRQLLEDLRDAGADKSEIAGELQEFRETWADPTFDDFKAITETRPGKITVIKFAYDKANEAASRSLVLTGVEVFDVLNRLLEPLGFQYVLEQPTSPPAPGEPEAQLGQGYGSPDKAGSENPPPPPVYGR